jgi:tetratricopeptide (TPR) repeat protein
VLVAEELGARAAGLLVSQAWDAINAGRFLEALSAAGRAVLAAGQLDDPVLLVRALDAEAAALQMTGDHAAALARYTRILGLAGDRATSGRLDDPAAARAHWNWVGCARFLTGIPVRDLFGVLEAADRWLEATGHRDWRAAVLLQRAHVHRRLGDHEAAAADAQEALAAAVRHPDAPGYTLATHRFQLGDMLREAGRAGSAATTGPITLPGPPLTLPWTALTMPRRGACWPSLTSKPAPWTPPPAAPPTPPRPNSAASGSTSSLLRHHNTHRRDRP